MLRTLELLAPAKNLEVGMAAIDHGADAVYIGADHFGARQAAGNSLEDIRRLCAYARPFGVKIYVTVNTIIYEDELSATRQLLLDLGDAGVDGLLIQDMGLLKIYEELQQEGHRLPALHASTQCDTRTAEKVRWLQGLGFRRAVLARELSVDEIRAIHAAVPDEELEVFVHGALCVSYSGICYASEYCFRRSANRGACAQFCRLQFDLVDNTGKVIEHDRHLLSLKDMCQIDHLEELADAGACSFKIEGRLKNADYVKNVVAAYSQRLDAIIRQHPDRYRRASRGRVAYTFEPSLKKTFNRGFTTYFLNGRQPDIASFDTPKAIGEYVGKVKEIGHGWLTVAGISSFANGDGLCFLNSAHELEGFRVNRVSGNRLFPLHLPKSLHKGQALYRNQDVAFEKILSGKTAERKIPVVMVLMAQLPDQFALTMAEMNETEGKKPEVDFKRTVTVKASFALAPAQKLQHENIVRQLTKLGNTPYVCEKVLTSDGSDQYFIPSSILAQLRRDAVEAMEAGTDEAMSPMPAESTAARPSLKPWQREYAHYPYLYNISNSEAKAFYVAQGLEHIAPAYEVERTKEPMIMQCRHCIRYALGYCVKRGGRKPTWQEPLFLQLADGRRFRLQFQCDECQMNIIAM
ncbi:MAG: U32 family peptidase [Prevotella sp.]|nr:U32 family peptidase [Prevotella sp.]